MKYYLALIIFEMRGIFLSLIKNVQNVENKEIKMLSEYKLVKNV